MHQHASNNGCVISCLVFFCIWFNDVMLFGSINYLKGFKNVIYIDSDMNALFMMNVFLFSKLKLILIPFVVSSLKC